MREDIQEKLQDIAVLLNPDAQFSGPNLWRILMGLTECIQILAEED